MSADGPPERPDPPRSEADTADLQGTERTAEAGSEGATPPPARPRKEAPELARPPAPESPADETPAPAEDTEDPEEQEESPRQRRRRLRAERQAALAAEREEAEQQEADEAAAVQPSAKSERPQGREGTQKVRRNRKDDTDADDVTFDEDNNPRARKRRDVFAIARRQAERARSLQDEETGKPARPDYLPPAKRRTSQDVGRTVDVPTRELTESEREAEIAEIQRDLVRRRRRRWTLLWLRLAFFIALPTFLVGNFYYNHATDFYSAKSAFVVDRASSPGLVGGAGLLAGTTFASAPEAIKVQEYLTSREIMRTLDSELGILAHWSDPRIDPIQRLAADATENDAYTLFKDRVLVGFDTTEGIIRLEIIAATPEMTQILSRRLIELAELRVDQMSDRTQADGLAVAERTVREATEGLDAAYEEVLSLQEKLGIFSADLEMGMIQGMIGSLTTQLEERRLTRAALLENARPNQAQLRVLDAEIARLEEAIEERRQLIVSAESENASLARTDAELERARANLEVRNAMLLAAVESRELARRDASQQSLYLTMVVNPVLPEVASYPRRLEYTILSFIIFFALYMIASLTVSILREQMSYGTQT